VRDLQGREAAIPEPMILRFPKDAIDGDGYRYIDPHIHCWVWWQLVDGIWEWKGLWSKHYYETR
jgi:hypothetical protein